MAASAILPHIDELARKELIDQIYKWKVSSYIELPSEWAEQNRYLPQGVSNLPGKINHEIAPHMVDICDDFHPDSGIVSISVMKSTQSLATTTIEHVIGWAIKNKLHNILYIISSKGMAKMRSSAAIDVLIDYSGLADYVKPISTRMKRKTADNTFYKEFSGGFRLMMTSWNSIADAKSFSWDLIIMDEIDEAPPELKGQGDPEKLFEVRGVTARHLKIAKISTPTTDKGRINQNFLQGDQRFHYEPCPDCGEKQVLEIMVGGIEHGLTAKSETIDKVEQIIPETVKYICKFCKKEIFEYQKQWMLSNGVWVPTARPINEKFRSYHISNLMSPIMFFTWQKVMEGFLETAWGQNIMKYKSYMINILGKPWVATTEKKDWEELKARADDYKLRDLMPTGALIPIGGADIQKRWIELVVVAWGRDLESWVIDHQKFYAENDTSDRKDRCWVDFANYIKTKKYKFRHRELPIALTAIDTGYNPDAFTNKGDSAKEHTVYEFVARTPRTEACRGNSKLKDSVVKEERVKRKSPLAKRYDVAVNEIKDEILDKIDIPAGGGGTLHFSKYLEDDFFKGFLSEVYMELEPNKWGYGKIFERNEPWDCWILSRAGAEILNLPSWTTEIWDEYEMKIVN